jgi:WD40 repeat protein
MIPVRLRGWFARLAAVLAALAATSIAAAASQAPAAPAGLVPTLDLNIGHTGFVNAVAYSPDGALLATGSWDNTVKLWNPRTGELQRTLPVGGESIHNVYSIAFTRNSRLLAAAGWGFVRLWDPQTGDSKGTLTGHDGWIQAVQFSPNGSTLASASDDKTIKLWSVGTGRELRTLTDHTGPVRGLQYTPDGKLLASVSDDKTVRLWNAETGVLVRTLPGHSGPVYSVALSADGALLASGGAVTETTGEVRLWELPSGRPVQTVSVPHKWANSLAFTPDGSHLAVGTRDGYVELRDTRTGQLAATLRESEWSVPSVAFSPDGKTLAAAQWDKVARLWDVHSRRLVRTLGRPDLVNSVALSADGSLLASASTDQLVRLWDPATGELKRVLTEEEGQGISVAFSPQGKLLASAGWGGYVRLWDAATGTSRTLGNDGTAVQRVAFSPNGAVLASTGNDGHVRVRDVRSGELRQTLAGPTKEVTAVAISPDSTLIAAASDDQNAYVWDLATGKLKGKLPGHKGPLWEVQFAPNGKTLATGAKDPSIRIWDAVTLRQVGELRAKEIEQGEWISIAFSPDGKTIAATNQWDTDIRLWDLPEGKPRTPLRGHITNIGPVAFSRDGSRIVSGGADCTVRLWDARKGALLATLLDLPSQDLERPIVVGAKAVPADGKPVEAAATARDYLAITPAGYYAASAAADRHVRFNLGRYSFPAECFQRRYHRPELVRRALAAETLAPIGGFKGPYPPAAVLTAPARVPPGATSIQVTVTATDDSGFGAVTLKADGTLVDAKQISSKIERMVAGAKPIVVGAKEIPTTHVLSQTVVLEVTLKPGAAVPRLQAIVLDDDNLSSPQDEVSVQREEAEAVTGRLLGLCVGVSRYQDVNLNLRFARRDADALAAALRGQKGLYSAVEMRVLADEQATRAEVVSALDDLVARAGPADTLLFFLSGHGWRSDPQTFFFATHDVVRTNIPGSALAWTEVTQRLAAGSKRGRRVLVLLDACHSGSAATNDDLVRTLKEANAGVAVFASSKGSELSRERSDIQHGVFTAALLDLLRAPSAPDGEPPLLTLFDLAYLLRRKVAEMTKQEQHPQVPLVKDFDNDAAVFTRS